jgi:hypothetical protein
MCAQNEYPQSQSCWARMKHANHPDDMRNDYFFLRRRPNSRTMNASDILAIASTMVNALDEPFAGGLRFSP